MEVMDTSLDKFYPKVNKHNLVINEDILGKVIGLATSVRQTILRNLCAFFSRLTSGDRFHLQIAVAVVNALFYLHANLKVIHRDVKPSNILINRRGQVKMCDFGISGNVARIFGCARNIELQTSVCVCIFGIFGILRCICHYWHFSLAFMVIIGIFGVSSVLVIYSIRLQITNHVLLFWPPHQMSRLSGGLRS